MKRLTVIISLVLATTVGLVARPGPSRGDGGPYLVRAIFDNAAFAVPGEQVRIAGAPIGSIQSLAVTRKDQAAVTLSVTAADFSPWYANATCAIRPQSLIAERYVDCEPGSSSHPALARITSGGGAGSYLLPVSQTVSPIDPDVVQDISQDPLRERLSIILNELGTGLAARGSDLNAVIRRADPALGDTDKVFQILARQNRVLAQLATDSDAVLQPLAGVRHKIADFIVQANTTAVASATRAVDTSRSVQLLPSFLRQLRPLMVDLQQLADQGTPLMESLGDSALSIDRQFKNLTPFAKAARPALIALGKSAHASQPSLIATEPLAHRLNQLGTQAEPTSALLDRLTSSLNSTGAIEQLMGVLFNATGAANGFDSVGHYVRAEPLVGGCTAYSKKPVPGCSANFGASDAADAARASSSRKTPSTSAKAPAVPAEATSLIEAALSQARATDTGDLAGLLHYLVGGKQ